MIAGFLYLALANAAPSTTSSVPVESPPISDQAQSSACDDANRRAIGFWVGQWDVFPTGQRTEMPIATSRIEWVVGGCAVRESYLQTVDENGKPIRYQGTSYTALNTLEGVWKQFYVDTVGRAALLTGSLANSTLVLSKATGSNLTRMTIRALDDGSVRQLGEASVDGGKSWKPTFDFTYRRHALE